MRNTNNQPYVFQSPITSHQILEKAAEIIAYLYVHGDMFACVEATKDYLSCKLATYEQEVFAVMLLDNQHRLIKFKELFFGTIDGASVYPREVVKMVLNANAAAVIFAHPPPSASI